MGDCNIRNILVVDDNEILVHSIERHLGREGFEVVVAYDGRMAKDLVMMAESVGRPFDLVIADVHMSNMAGFVFVSWLNLQFPTVSVVVISSFGNLDLVNRMLRPGYDFLHKKPVVPQEIMKTIKALNRHRKEKGCLAKSA